MHSLAQYLESQRSYRDKQGCKRDEKSKRPRKPEYRRVETWQKYCQRHGAGEDISPSCVRFFSEKVGDAADKPHYIYDERRYKQLPENQRQAQEIYLQPFADYSPRNGRVSLMKPGGDGEAAAVEYAEKMPVVGL